MIRFTSIVVCVVSLLLITAIVNGAGNPPAPAIPLVVEIAAIETNAKASTQQLDPLALPSGDLKPLNTIKSLVGKDGSFLSEATIGDRVIRLSGEIKAADDKHRRVSADYSDKSTNGVQSITSMIELSVGESKAVGGMTGAGTRSLLVLTLREREADPK